MTAEAFICDGVRTPIGRFGGALAAVRPDDLGAVPIAALMARNPRTDWAQVDDVLFGCANQAGEDNRNVARMASLLAGLPETVPGATVNRLCGSGMDAIGSAARAIKAGEAALAIAGGVESMTRAPFVMAKAETAFSRQARIEDTTLGWRFVNPLMKAAHGTHSMPETAENVAEEYQIARQRPGRLRVPQPAPRGASDRGRPAGERDRPGRGAPAQGRAGARRARRASPPADHAGGPRGIADAVSGGWNGDRRQRVGRQ